jgi:site-specific DNA recombinase
MTKRAVIYTRTAVATGQNVNDRQAEQCRAYAAEHGWDVIEVFTDDGMSGSSPNRPRLDAVMHLIRNRECDALVAYDMTRFTRDASGLASILADADAVGVTVATADGRLGGTECDASAE